jgi:hypothetical protein
VFYAPTVAKQCRETVAEEVRDKQRANVCDYFSPRADAFQKTVEPGDAQAQLAALFGVASAISVINDAVGHKVKDKATAAASARSALDELFKK